MISIVKPKYTVEEVHKVYESRRISVMVRHGAFAQLTCNQLLVWVIIIDVCLGKKRIIECEKAITSLLEKLLIIHSFNVHFLSIAICGIIALLLSYITGAVYLWICGHFVKGESLASCPFSRNLLEKYTDILRKESELVVRDGDIYENYEKMKNMLQEARDVISFVGNRDDIEVIKVDSDYVKVFRKDGAGKKEKEFCFPGYIESIFRPDKIDFSVLDAFAEEKFG